MVWGRAEHAMMSRVENLTIDTNLLRIACRHAPKDQLIWRHIGVTPDEAQDMVKVIGCDSLDQLIDETVPPHLRFKGTADLPEPIGERAMLQEMVSVGAKNKVYRTFLGQGCVLPHPACRSLLRMLHRRLSQAISNFEQQINTCGCMLVHSSNSNTITDLASLSSF